MLNVVGHRVLVKTAKLEEVDPTYASAEKLGIQIVSKVKEAEQKAVDRGTVVQVGDTAYKDFGGQPWCKVGDEVIFSRFAGKVTEDPYTKEEFTVLNDEDILLVVTKEE